MLPTNTTWNISIVISLIICSASRTYISIYKTLFQINQDIQFYNCFHLKGTSRSERGQTRSCLKLPLLRSRNTFSTRPLQSQVHYLKSYNKGLTNFSCLADLSRLRWNFTDSIWNIKTGVHLPAELMRGSMNRFPPLPIYTFPDLNQQHDQPFDNIPW